MIQEAPELIGGHGDDSGQFRFCQDADGQPIKDHCPIGRCVFLQERGQPGVGFIIYECRNCGCFEGL